MSATTAKVVWAEVVSASRGEAAQALSATAMVAALLRLITEAEPLMGADPTLNGVTLAALVALREAARASIEAE